jgi:predicted Zn-dependent protease
VAHYSNPELPEGINDSDRTPLRNLAWLAGTAALVGAAAAAALAFGGGTLARYVPYEAEVRLVRPYADRYPPRVHVAENYLQRVADRLVDEGRVALEDGMAIRVHFVDEPVVNAFATLGGHIAVYRGLVARMPDENALAMVVAHEIAHVRHRHPIASLGRGVAFGAVLSLFSTGAGSAAAGSVMGSSGLLTILTFNRAQEAEADETGIAALAATYGHAGGATDTFAVLGKAAAEPGRAEPPEFLRTHPVTGERLDRLSDLIRRHGWAAEGTRTPIPAVVVESVES